MFAITNVDLESPGNALQFTSPGVGHHGDAQLLGTVIHGAGVLKDETATAARQLAVTRSIAT